MSAVVRFRGVFREPPPPEREQLELFDLPELPKRDSPKALLAEIAENFDTISALVDAVRVGLVLLEDHCEDEP
jgi:hypothetical protein